MTNCDRKGCKNQGIYRPVLIMPAPAYTGSNAKIEIQIGLNICKEHTENTNIDDYLSDKGWEQITSALRGMHRAIPNRESVYVIFNKIEAATPTSSRQDELSFEQQQDITKILELYRANPSNSNKYRFELFAKINSIIAHHTQEAVEAAREKAIDDCIAVVRNKQLEDAEELAKRMSELSAPQQSTSPDGEKKDGDE